MCNIIYICSRPEIFCIINNAKCIPNINDNVFLKVDKLGLVKFKVVQRAINHSGEDTSGMKADMFYITLELD